MKSCKDLQHTYIYIYICIYTYIYIYMYIYILYIYIYIYISGCRLNLTHQNEGNQPNNEPTHPPTQPTNQPASQPASQPINQLKTITPIAINQNKAHRNEMTVLRPLFRCGVSWLQGRVRGPGETFESGSPGEVMVSFIGLDGLCFNQSSNWIPLLYCSVAVW